MADRPVSIQEQSESQEVEITSEMLLAGVTVLEQESETRDHWSLAARVYRAMTDAAPFPRRSEQPLS